MTNNLRARIDQGVDFLENVTPGWREGIDLNKLDLASGSSCVIGQTFCHQMHSGATAYTLGMWAVADWEGTDFESGYIDMSEYGFETQSFEEEEGYDALQSAWVMRVLLPVSHVVAQA